MLSKGQKVADEGGHMGTIPGKVLRDKLFKTFLRKYDETL
jgi:hypothetical protein